MQGLTARESACANFGYARRNGIFHEICRSNSAKATIDNKCFVVIHRVNADDGVQGSAVLKCIFTNTLDTIGKVDNLHRCTICKCVNGEFGHIIVESNLTIGVDIFVIYTKGRCALAKARSRCAREIFLHNVVVLGGIENLVILANQVLNTIVRLLSYNNFIGGSIAKVDKYGAFAFAVILILACRDKETCGASIALRE